MLNVNVFVNVECSNADTGERFDVAILILDFLPQRGDVVAIVRNQKTNERTCKHWPVEPAVDGPLLRAVSFVSMMLAISDPSEWLNAPEKMADCTTRKASV